MTGDKRRGGVLHLLARNAGNACLATSADHGATWTWADWAFTESFGCPTFVQYGRDHAGARDGYAYVASPDAETPSYWPVRISWTISSEVLPSLTLTLQPVFCSNGVTQLTLGSFEPFSA